MRSPPFTCPTETLTFLADLRANSTEPWFDANRHRHEASYLAPAKALADTIVGAGAHGFARLAGLPRAAAAEHDR